MAPTRTKVFISYSHKDDRWLERLQVHLKSLERQGLVDTWDDTRIKPGADWHEEIEQALASTKVAVLLVSADFLASDFIHDNELPPLLEAAEKGGGAILPLIVAPSLFDQTPSLARFQALNPSNKPLSGLTKAKQEEALVEAAKAILEALKGPAPASRLDRRNRSADADTRPPTTSPGDPGTASRLNAVKMGLSPHAMDIYAVLTAIFNRLDRMEKQGISDTDQGVLEELEAFIAGNKDKDELLEFWGAQSEPPPSATPTIDYNAHADALRAGEVALFLGQDLPALYQADIPSTRDLPAEVAKLADDYRSFGNSLSEICEYVALQPKKSRGTVKKALLDATRPKPETATDGAQLFDLLAGLDEPFLVFSSGYDCLLEQYLLGTKRPFVVISPPPRGDEAAGLVLEYPSERRRENERMPPDKLSGIQLMEGGEEGDAPRYSIIYRLRGQVYAGKKDSLLLTEGDYLAFANSSGLKLPNYLKNRLDEQQLWFLGHDPHAWEDRLLSKVLLEHRDPNAPTALAVQTDADAFARAFWRRYRVEYQDGVGLTDFIAGLRVAP